jgi:hypothetical protein
VQVVGWDGLGGEIGTTNDELTALLWAEGHLGTYRVTAVLDVHTGRVVREYSAAPAAMAASGGAA